MLTVKIVCIGTIKEKFITDGCDEFLKRLSAFCKVQIVQIKEERLQKENDADIARVIQKEGEMIVREIQSGHTIALCIEGKSLSSEELAVNLQTLMTSGVSTVNFVIGGSYGLSDSVKQKADFKLSFSKMTFTHQMARMILLEQIYRAFAINSNIKYHK